MPNQLKFPFGSVSHQSNIADTICNLLSAAFADEQRAEFSSLSEKYATNKYRVVAHAISMLLSDDYLLISRLLPASLEKDQSPFVTRYRSGNDTRKPSRKIFISYRRADASPVASRLFCELTNTFGERNIFFDINAMPFGIPFRHALRQAISEVEIFLLLIGPSWLSPNPCHGKSRLHDPNDPVRLEIESALSVSAPIVPVLIENAANPFVSQLPDNIQAICDLNFVRIGSPGEFNKDFETLVKACKERARNRGLEYTLPMPDLDGDSLISVRTLTAACIYFRNLAHQLLGEKHAGATVLRAERDTIEEVDGLLQRWGRFIGERLDNEGSGTRLAEMLEQLLVSTYGTFDANAWERMADALKSHVTIEPSKEQLVAMAAAEMIHEAYFVNKRSGRLSSTKDNFFINLDTLIRADQKANNTDLVLIYSSAVGNHFHAQLLECFERAFGDRLVTIDSEDALRANQLETAAGVVAFVDDGLLLASCAGRLDREAKHLEIAISGGAFAVPVILPGVDLPSRPGAFVSAMLEFTAIQLSHKRDPALELQRTLDAVRWLAFPHLIHGEPALPSSVSLAAIVPLSTLVRSGLYMRSVVAHMLYADFTDDREAHGKVAEDLYVREMADRAIYAWGVYLGLLESPHD
jgi:TIR domain